jgi:hypothetical protein
MWQENHDLKQPKRCFLIFLTSPTGGPYNAGFCLLRKVLEGHNRN